jgi:hypothetical protein
LNLGQRQVLPHAHVREQLEVLEHHADAGAQARQVGLRVADRNAVDRDAPCWKGSRPLTHLISVDLPEPDGPQTTTTSPLATVVLHRLEHLGLLP